MTNHDTSKKPVEIISDFDAAQRDLDMGMNPKPFEMHIAAAINREIAARAKAEREQMFGKAPVDQALDTHDPK